MMRAYAIDQVRAAEAAAMEGLRPGALMQRAAKGLARIAKVRLTERGGRSVAVLVGSGDNGGDALYAGARLAKRGRNVAAILVGKKAHEAGLRTARKAGVVIAEWPQGEPDEQVRTLLGEADLVIDGILGIGGKPGLPAHLAGLEELLSPTAYVLAVDLPSGCDPAGLVAAECIYADETVTFSLLKPCHLMPASEPAIGLLTVVEIGVPEPETVAVQRMTPDDAAGLWPIPGPFDDKYSRGVLGVVTGSEQYTGAAVLSSTAAVTAGVGMVRYVGPQRPRDLVQLAVPEVVVGDGRCQAWLVGSGWSMQDADPEQLRVAHEQLDSEIPLVLDAGGLDLLDGPRSGPTLVTPHAGELHRLAERLGLPESEGVPAAQAVADALGVTVLLKGSVTAVVSPADSGEPIRTQADGPSWLATAGSGDVLAGLTGALLSAGLAAADVGALAAMVHGMAADRANPGGPVRALDIAHSLGGTVAELLRS